MNKYPNIIQFSEKTFLIILTSLGMYRLGIQFLENITNIEISGTKGTGVRLIGSGIDYFIASSTKKESKKVKIMLEEWYLKRLKAKD